MSSDSDDNTTVPANNWTHVLRHAENGVFPADTMMCFSRNGVTALTFHAGNESIGVVCSKCFKFFRPGSFSQHAEDCKDSLPPGKSMVKKWKDSAHLWANLRRDFGKEGELSSKTSIWVARRDGKVAYVLHPSWCLSTSRKLRAMCITDGCTHVCALNGLQRHVKAAHYKGNYDLRELEVIDVPSRGVGGNGDSVSVANENTGDDDHEGEEKVAEEDKVEEVKEEVALEDVVEEGSDEEKPSNVDDRRQLTTLISERLIAEEDFEEYQPRGGPSDESTGGEPNDHESIGTGNEEVDIGTDGNKMGDSLAGVGTKEGIGTDGNKIGDPLDDVWTEDLRDTDLGGDVVPPEKGMEGTDGASDVRKRGNVGKASFQKKTKGNAPSHTLRKSARKRNAPARY